MKAVLQNAYGSPDVLQIKEMKKPEGEKNEVPVRVHAAALNAGDVFSLRGSPWLVRFSLGFPRPKDHIPGWDMAGRVEAVGDQVTRFRPGDEVFASCSHTPAEYVNVPEDKVTPKPANLTFVQATAVPTAAVTARQVAGMYLASSNDTDMVFLSDLIEAGKLRPVIDRTYPLHQTADAFCYLEESHAQGKVVITVIE